MKTSLPVLFLLLLLLTSSLEPSTQLSNSIILKIKSEMVTYKLSKWLQISILQIILPSC